DVKKINLDAFANEFNKRKLELEDLLRRLHDVTSFKELDLEDTKYTSIISNRYETWRKDVKVNKKLSRSDELSVMIEKIKKITNSQEKMAMIGEAEEILHRSVKSRKVYVKKNIENTKYYSSLEEKDGDIFFNSLQPKVSSELKMCPSVP
ncbi:unnamed protein product, partial [Meganyctiphanes norvegica]